MIKLCYFASVREAVGTGSEFVDLPPGVSTVEELVATLGEKKRAVLSDRSRVLIAVNQAVAERGQRLCGDEEIAFFPPMTGG